MSRVLKTMAVLCLLLSATAIPSAPSFAQPVAPADVDANTAVDAVNDLAQRMKDAAADVGRHRFAPVYYAEPCAPTKEDGERSLAPYRAQRRAFLAEISALKSRIIEIEGFSSSAVTLANKGWSIHDQNRFRALDQAYRAYDRAIAAKEAELDAMPVQPCRRAQPRPPRDPDGPLTPGEERQFEDFPLATPTFDDPVTMPAPPKFCTYAERRAWMDSVYWPTVNRAQANALKAIEAFGKAEARLREVRNNDRPDSPRIALAEQSVRYWEAEKNRRMAEHQRLLAIDVPNPVDCGQPSTTTGTTGTTGGTTTASPPPADGPAAAPPPPLPPGIVRPDLVQVTVPRLPARFCSEKEKLDFLVDVYHPAADTASKNALKTSTYRARLSRLIVEANERGDTQAFTALQTEHDAYEPIADAADALAQRMYRMRAEILAIPVVDCSKPDQPGTAAAPPVDEEPGLEEMIVQGTRIRSEPDGSPPGPPAPNLARPQFERVREFTIPATFCSAQERNDFLNNVYNPAVASALANARTAQAHQAKLNALFTEHMRANSPHWGAVRAERDAFEAITNEALAKSGALNDLYVKIMAVPIVPCVETGDEADPVGEEPPATTPSTPSGPKPPSTGMAPGANPVFRDFPPFKLRNEFCTQEEAEAYQREVEARLAEIREERERLETLVGLMINERYALLVDNAMPEGWREGLTAEEIRLKESRHFADAGRMASGADGKDMSEAQLAEFGRAFLAFGRPGIEHIFAYDQEIRRLESARRQTLETIAAGRYGPCPKKPCPPKKGRDPISVGPNSKVGSGAQLRSKIGGMATGAVLGALGVGGGGGGSEPRLWVCKIKDSEYTVFNDPLTGVSLRVGAKRAKGGKVIIFSEIAKSPDKGTFQTAFLERPSTGETMAPSDIGPCDLWGEWKLTVSWTRTTYVNGQMTSQESGGWSEGGFFKIPGTLSQMDAPDGFWKQMGFSSAQMGAREMGMIFDLPPGGGPLTFVIHVTRPKGDPVTTVPFVLTMTEGAGGGFTFTQAEDPPCPPEDLAPGGAGFDFGPASTVPAATPEGLTLAGPGAATTTAPPAGNPGPAGTTPASGTPPPTSGPAGAPPAGSGAGAIESAPEDPPLPTSDLFRTQSGVDTLRTLDLDARRALDASRCKGPEEWPKRRRSYLSSLRARVRLFKRILPVGRDAAAIQAAIDAELVRLMEEITEVEAMEPPPAPTVCPPTDEKDLDSILDEIDEVRVIA